jgi:DNA-binding MarR family transcriptional regulator
VRIVSRDRLEKDTDDASVERRERLIGALGREMQKLVAGVVLFNQAVGDRLGMRPTDLQCLNVLLETGPVAAGRLAEETGLTKGAVTGMIDRLERAGYVWREKDPQDRRRVIVHPLPERARRDIGPLYASVGRSFAQMCSRYDDEELALILDFVGRSHPLNREETAKLRGEASREPNEGDGFAAPLGPATSGRLVFERGASAVDIRVDPSIEALFRARFEDPAPRIRSQGGTVAVRQRHGRSWPLSRGERTGGIVINATIPWEIEIRGGAAGLSAELSALALESLEIKGGASATLLMLPHPSGTVTLRVLGGVSDITIQRPNGVGVRVLVRGGASELFFDEQHFGAVGGETRWQSPDYDGATDRYDIEVTGGANGLTVDDECANS